MSKRAAVSMAVLLWIGSSASGNVTGALSQIQNTNVGLSSAIDLFNGDQAAGALQNLAVQNHQSIDKPNGAFLTQSAFGMFAEVGQASGNNAIIGVLQDLSAIGMQAQLLSDGIGPKTQGQNLSLTADQGILKTDGAGTGSALHQLQFAADQEAGNAAGMMSQSGAIVGLQNAQVTGAATATGQVESLMSVATVQSQAAQ